MARAVRHKPKTLTQGSEDQNRLLLLYLCGVRHTDTMFENLNQPYPFNNNFKHNLRTIAFVCMGFMLISLYFQPFGIDFMASARNGYFILILGLISGIIFFFNTLLLPGFFPKLFDSTKWTIRKELIWNTGMYAALAVGFFVSAIIFRHTGAQSVLFFQAIALALLPLVLFNIMNYNHVLKLKLGHLIDTGRHWFGDEHLDKTNDKEIQVHLKSEKGEVFYQDSIQNLILVQSASNYIEVYMQKSGVVQRKLIRQTLQAIEEQLAAYPEIIKSHRRCLVNIKHMTRVVGKSPSYWLEAKGIDFHILLSRQRASQFRQILSAQ